MQEFLFFNKGLFGNGWFYISIVEFIIIVILLLCKVTMVSKRCAQKHEILSTSNVDYDNIIQSSFNSKPLYDSLKKKCHPDRFVDKEKNMIATGIFAKIVENKYNYQVLLSIKEEAETKLKLKI